MNVLEPVYVDDVGALNNPAHQKQQNQHSKTNPKSRSSALQGGWVWAPTCLLMGATLPVYARWSGTDPRSPRPSNTSTHFRIGKGVGPLGFAHMNSSLGADVMLAEA